jgi:hypothetical protein
MHRSTFFLLGMALAALANGPAMAQQRGAMPPIGRSEMNPGISLSQPATVPLQQQMQDNYAADLRGEQRDLLQQNSSGLTRPELAIGRELNGFTPR